MGSGLVTHFLDGTFLDGTFLDDNCGQGLG